jgi:hypothetical protein
LNWQLACAMNSANSSANFEEWMRQVHEHR